MFVTLVLALAILLVPRWGGLRRARRSTIDEPRFYMAVHSALESGASLHRAIAAAADGSPQLAGVRVAAAGGSTDEIAHAMRVLPGGEAAGAAVRVAARSGGKAADVFLRLAERAAADTDVARQRRVLTAQSRLSAAIVGGLPIVWLAFGGVARLESLVAAGGAPIAVLGLGMEATGVALVWRLASA